MLPGFTPIARMIILIGVILVLLGLFLLFVDRIPFIGRLPGDIYIRRKNFTFYFPIVTCIILSILLSLILRAVLRR